MQFTFQYEVRSTNRLKIYLYCLYRLFLFGPWIEYGIDRQLTKHTQCSATVAISTRMGVLLRLKYNSEYERLDRY